jgi:RimJ/RimL family protein N-acetyltransferase
VAPAQPACARGVTMAQNDFVVMDDDRALQTLDVYYGMALGCSAADLRRSGWKLVAARREGDPMALLFGQRALVSLVSPDAAVRGDEVRGGVAVVTPELRMPLGKLLRELPPEELFTPDGLDALDHLMTQLAPKSTLLPGEGHLRIRYVSQDSFRPYVGPWQEWIEPLDETSELDPAALSLLARYSGGVYVVKSEGAIVSFAGIRPQSPHVSEIGVRTDAAELRGNGLARAVVSRATRAVLAANRLPLYRHRATNIASERVALALGYRFYADAIEYVAPVE